MFWSTYLRDMLMHSKLSTTTAIDITDSKKETMKM